MAGRRWPGRSRCAGAARRRTRADRATRCPAGSPTDSSASATSASAARPCRDPQRAHRLPHDASHALARVQRGVGVLEDRLHAAAERADLRPIPQVERDPVEQDPAGGRAQAGRAAAAPACSCPSRTRRPAPTLCPARWRARRPARRGCPWPAPRYAKLTASSCRIGVIGPVPGRSRPRSRSRSRAGARSESRGVGVARRGRAARRCSLARPLRPHRITRAWSVMRETTARSWLTKSIAMLRSATRRSSSASTSDWTVTSRAVVGSSAISSRGRQARAMAMATRCRCPPEIS